MNEEVSGYVLLVEDDPRDVELIKRAIAESGVFCRMEVAKDGAEALDFIRSVAARGDEETLPRAVFLDLKLPKVDGAEVLERIKTDERTRSIPVIVLSSSPEQSDLVRSYKMGVNSYIVKPVDFDNFMKAVGNMAYYWMTLNRLPQTNQSQRKYS